MTRSVILISVLLFLGAALPQTAQASFWVECDVTADVKKTDQDGLYHIIPQEAVVTDGHVAKGSACLADKKGELLHVKIDGDKIPAGENIRLQYRHYNAMGPNDVVDSETWTAVE
jgi:hypothetical protein